MQARAGFNGVNLMKRTVWAGLLLGGLLTASLAASRAQAATCDRQDGMGTCAFCNGTGVDPEAPWHRLVGRPCRQCGGTGIHQPGVRKVASGALADDRPTARIREFG